MRIALLSAAICIAWLGAGSIVVQGSNSSKGDLMVIDVLCNDQGQTDHRQRITVTVDDGDPSTPPIEATSSLLEHSTSRDFAVQLAAILREKGCPGAYTSEPTIKKGNDNYDPLQSEQLNLPAGFGFTKGKVEKLVGTRWRDKKDHVQIAFGGKQTSKRIAEPLELTYHTLDFSLNDFSSTPLRMTFHIEGFDLDDGSVVNEGIVVEYPQAHVLPFNRLRSVGQYLQGLGMTVTYPTNKTLHAVVDPSNIQIDTVSFSAAVLVEDLSAASHVTFGFRPN